MFNFFGKNKKKLIFALSGLIFALFAGGIYLASSSQLVFANISLVCPPGSSLSGANCVAANKFPVCPAGGQVQGTQCVATPGTPVMLTNLPCTSFHPVRTKSVFGGRTGQVSTVTVLNVADYASPMAGVPACHAIGSVMPEIEHLVSISNFCLPQDGAAYRLKPSGIIACGVDFSAYNSDESGNTVSASFVFQKRAISGYSYGASYICPTGWSDAGGANCFKPAITITSTAPNLPITQASIANGSCNGQTIQVNNLFDCIFALSGSSNGQYSSTSPIEAALPWGTISRSCAISGANLICRNITANPNANNPDTQAPRIGNGVGVYLRLDPNGNNWLMKGSVNVSSQSVPASNQQGVKAANITTVAQKNDTSNSEQNSVDNSSSSSDNSSSSQNTSEQSNSEQSKSKDILKTFDFVLEPNSNKGNFSPDKVKLVCNFGNPAMIASSVTCSFDLPNDKQLPADLKIAVGDQVEPSGNCTVINSTSVICTNVPTDSQVGEQNIFVQIGSESKVDTQNKLELVENAMVGTTIRSGGFLALSAFLFLAGISAVVFFYIRKRSKGMLFG